MRLLLLFILIPNMLVAQEHKFWDKTNLGLHLANAAAQTADAITTQRNLRVGERELHPIARPFVENGWLGQTAYSGLSVAIPLGLSYLLHKKSHHKWERIAPVFWITNSGVSVGLNLRL